MESSAETKILIAYFTGAENAVDTSRVDATTSASVQAPGNVARMAAWIQQETGGDLFSIRVEEPYSADYETDSYAIGSVAERMELYRRCEMEGVGISVMKAFSGGQLLDAKTSPFGRALTEYQCIQYALDKPGVLTVLPGVRNMADLRRVLGFCNAAPEEKDYSVLGSFAPQRAMGKCVYCNHCQPCPAGLDVGLINKYYDLARSGDELARNHYENLTVKAESCVRCGHCDSRCPFHVNQMARMQEIAGYFNC